MHNWTTYLGADQHPRRAHGFFWMAVNRNGDNVVPWSWWPDEENQQREEDHEARLTVKEYAEGLTRLYKAAPYSPMVW